MVTSWWLPRDAAVLYWRVRIDEPGLGTFTDDVWMHVRGIGDPRNAVTRSRASADSPIRTGEGIGIPDVGFTDVIATAERAARGAFDVGDARTVAFAGHDAYAVRVRAASGPVAGARRNPSELSVTLWVEPEAGRPVAVRWDEGEEHWRTGRILAFERLPDDARNRALLDLR